jgi:uncharacterized protein (TIGR02757 family)
VVRRYESPADREIAGFCAAALAFGRVTSIIQSIEALLTPMGASPAAFVRRFDPVRDGMLVERLVHRWTRGPDFVALLLILRRMLEESGSLEDFFLRGYDPLASNVGPALESFSERARAIDVAAVYGGRKSRPGVYYFFTQPSSGSGCKRLNLFLRWMVRRDHVDFGVWSRVSPSKLVIPLDTHVVRVGRCLGLTRYTSPGWRMAQQITRSLASLDPDDPVKYDFSLCHVGMMDACGFNRKQGDSRCPLRGVCRPHGRRPRASSRPSGQR